MPTRSFSSRRRESALSRSAVRATCRHLMRKLGPSAKGKFVAVETRTGKAYLGDTSLEAVQAGRRESPGATFFIERLGYRVAATMKRRR